MTPPPIAPLSRADARARLNQLEMQRTDPHGRQLFWSESSWRTALDNLARCEDAEDQQLSYGLADLTPASEREIDIQRQLDAQIEDDRRWYESRVAVLDMLRLDLEAQGLTQSPGYDEVVQHQHLVARRMWQRAAARARLALEMLERRRMAYGRLNGANWHGHWDALQQAVESQRQHTARGALPLLEADHLAWLRRLRSAQEEAGQQWHNQRSFDRADYAKAERTLVAAIDAYAPPRLPSGGWRWLVPALAIVGVIATCSGLWNGASRPSQSPESSTSAPQPTTVSAAPTAPVAPEAPPQGSASADAIAAYDEGLGLLRAGQCDAAIAAFDRAFAADPDWHLPLNDKAFCAYELGRIDLAIAAWQLALDRNPASPDAHAGLAMALLQSGEAGEAQDHYRRAVELDGRYRDAAWLREARAWSERAIADSEPLRQALP